ncbi:MAG: hypothetical protein ABIM98_07370 [candidate division WOR-3 bacterium]
MKIITSPYPDIFIRNFKGSETSSPVKLPILPYFLRDTIGTLMDTDRFIITEDTGKSERLVGINFRINVVGNPNETVSATLNLIHTPFGGAPIAVNIFSKAGTGEVTAQSSLLAIQSMIVKAHEDTYELHIVFVGATMEYDIDVITELCEKV